MKMNIYTKGYDLSDKQREHFESKLAKFDRFFDDDVEATVRVRTERSLEIVEVTIPMRGGDTLRAQEGTNELYASLDSVMEKLQRQIRKQRTRLEKRVRQGAYAKAEAAGELPSLPVEEISSRIVRTKQFKLSPMTQEDAISQMEMLGHSFFVFYNEVTDGICVVYQRDDGNVGLLIPEIG